MARTKKWLGIALALVVAVSQASLVAAAPAADPLVGTIDSISQGTDINGNTVIIVNYTDTDGNAQVRELSLADAEALGLISVDETTDPPTIVILVGQGSAIDLTPLEVDPCAPGAGAELTEGSEVLALEGEEDAAGHPVGTGLCEFFGGYFGLTYDQIMMWHEEGFGFGVIAQALWMAEEQGWDPAAVLAAKKGDFSGLTGLPEGVDNWGRLRQYSFGKGAEKVVHNLGEVMSGRADPLETPTPTVSPTATTVTTLSGTTLQVHGKGHAGEHGKGKGKGHNK